MTSIFRVPARTYQVLLLVSGFALILSGLLASGHVACAHHADSAGSTVQCAICRHLDGNPVAFVAVWSVSGVTAAIPLDPAPAPAPSRRPAPASRGRAPPPAVACS